MGKLNVPAILVKLKAAGYRAYAWKDGEEPVPEGLENYANALADKKFHEWVDKYLQEQKRSEESRMNSCNLSAGNLDGRLTGLPGGASVLDVVFRMFTSLSVLSPSMQNRAISITQTLIQSERDQQINTLKERKSHIDYDMKALDNRMSYLVNAQDQLTEKS